ncbi:MAG: aldehyde dehydrogenase family protein [Planctomycetota bacterium]|jgi:acyl-CoA reductase-like NAD-dependent aldehyde dehydrogenase
MTTLTPADAAVLASVDPATGETVGAVTVTPPARVPAVVAAARAAGPAWSDLGLAARLDRLRPAGPELVARAPELARLLTREMGKPLAEAEGEIRSCGDALPRTLDEIATALAPEGVTGDGVESTIHYDPLGVCAAITPWNFPLAMPHWLVVPALAAGNTVVLKPSEETPLVAQAYADLLAAHLPDGVLHVVHGADEQGRALVAADVDLVAFTGSREAGRQILGAAGPDLKRVILELGGKDPLVVLDDADVEAAAAFACRSSFRNAGQVCVSTERIYVDASIADAFEQALVRHAGEQRVGPGTGDGVAVGPMINARQRDHVLGQIDEAVGRGARVLAGGAGHAGNFVTPTVLGGVDHTMAIMRDETFGPVACVMRVAGADEAVALANDTPFGLGAVVFGTDPDRTRAVARRLTAGMVGINKHCGGADGTPWVGARQSGYGFHSGPAGHRQFTQPRVVSEAAGGAS